MLIPILTFLAGITLGFLFAWGRYSDKLPDKMHITVDVDTERLANIFTALVESDLTVFYLDFPGLKPNSSCRIYFTDTKKRLEKSIKN